MAGLRIFIKDKFALPRIIEVDSTNKTYTVQDQTAHKLNQKMEAKPPNPKGTHGRTLVKRLLPAPGDQVCSIDYIDVGTWSTYKILKQLEIASNIGILTQECTDNPPATKQTPKLYTPKSRTTGRKPDPQHPDTKSR